MKGESKNQATESGSMVTPWA